MKRTLAAIVSTLAMGATMLLFASPAGAGDPPPEFNEFVESVGTQVNGDYIPITGLRDCGGDAVAYIIWYAPGPAPDFMWDLDGDLGHTSKPLTINGTYKPSIADFDNDGCDDILWYAPGSAPDFLWFGDDSGRFTSEPTTINGTYDDVLASKFDGRDGADLFFVRYGSGAEYFWSGNTDRTFDKTAGPRVDGTYRAAVVSKSIIWHKPGPGTDYVWAGIAADGPTFNLATQINGTYEPLGLGGAILLYGPGTAPDFLIYDFDEDGTPLTYPGRVNGNYVTGTRSMSAQSRVVWHTPGPAPDFIWRVSPG